MAAGEEITFDYQFQRYGYVFNKFLVYFSIVINYCLAIKFRAEPQKCFCGTAACRGYIDKEKPKILEDGWNLDLGSSFEDEDKKKVKKQAKFQDDLEACCFFCFFVFFTNFFVNRLKRKSIDWLNRVV